MKGLFIVFEGIEGSGKSTQANLLYKKLRKEGIHCLITKEPGGTVLGNKLRVILKRGGPISPEAEIYLFNASRVQLLKEVILPAMAEGKVVISDRFYPSTVAYQGYGRGINQRFITALNEITTQGLKPDMVILLDMDEKKGLSRKSTFIRDRFEEEKEDFHRKVRKGYLEMMKKESGQWLLLDANQDRKKLAVLIYNEVKRKLTERG